MNISLLDTIQNGIYHFRNITPQKNTTKIAMVVALIFAGLLTLCLYKLFCPKRKSQLADQHVLPKKNAESPNEKKVQVVALDVMERGHNPNPPQEKNAPQIEQPKGEKKEEPKALPQKITLPNGTLMEGIFQEDLSGCGKALYPTGIIWEGNFIKGRIEGPGKITLESGETLEAEFIYHEDLPKISFSNGMIWKGACVNGLLEGRGEITLPRGEIYKGIFKEGFFSEPGEIIYPNGVIWEGLFSKNWSEIEGTIYLPEKDFVEDCHFARNEQNGTIKIDVRDQGTVRVWEGKMANGLLNGQGKILKIKENHKNKVWEGEFQNGSLKNGKYVCLADGIFEMQIKDSKGCKLISTDGGYLEGEFEIRERKYFGKGILLRMGRIWVGEIQESKLVVGKSWSANGLLYEGTFSNDQLIQGKITEPNGDFSEGSCIENQVHGYGKKYFANGLIVEGNFEMGKITGEVIISHPDGEKQNAIFEYITNDYMKVIFLQDGRPVHEWYGVTPDTLSTCLLAKRL